jgi:hypothetical protein
MFSLQVGKKSTSRSERTAPKPDDTPLPARAFPRCMSRRKPKSRQVGRPPLSPVRSSDLYFDDEEYLPGRDDDSEDCAVTDGSTVESRHSNDWSKVSTRSSSLDRLHSPADIPILQEEPWQTRSRANAINLTDDRSKEEAVEEAVPFPCLPPRSKLFDLSAFLSPNLTTSSHPKPESLKRPNDAEHDFLAEPAMTCTPGFFVARQFLFEDKDLAEVSVRPRPSHRSVPSEVSFAYSENDSTLSPHPPQDEDDCSIASEPSVEYLDVVVGRVETNTHGEESQEILLGLDFVL